MYIHKDIFLLLRKMITHLSVYFFFFKVIVIFKNILFNLKKIYLQLV